MVKVKFNTALALVIFLGTACVAHANINSAGLVGGHETLFCSKEDGTQSLIDVALFPQAIQVNGTKMFFVAVQVEKDGFRLMSYTIGNDSGGVVLGVKEGYRPILFEKGRSAPCRYTSFY